MAKGIHRASKQAANAIDSTPVSNATVLSTAAASGAVSAASPLSSTTVLSAASGAASTASPVCRAAVSTAASVVSAHSGSASTAGITRSGNRSPKRRRSPLPKVPHKNLPKRPYDYTVEENKAIAKGETDKWFANLKVTKAKAAEFPTPQKKKPPSRKC